jgi:hypothetical protein
MTMTSADVSPRAEGVTGALKLSGPAPKASTPLLNSGFDSSSAGLGAKALTSLVLRLSMMAFVDINPLLEGIDTSTSAPTEPNMTLCSLAPFVPH